MRHMQEAIASLLEDQNDEIPQWAEKMIEDIEEIKTLLRLQVRQKLEDEKRYFIRRVRRRLRANPKKGVYPVVSYAGDEYGVDAEGMLFCSKTDRALSAKEAFEIFDFLYRNRNRLQEFIKGIAL